ncbi:hypothetical protein Tco_0132452 [Tanacetum coccineum]
MNTASTSRSGTLPSNTITNPREDLKGITTRSSIAYKGPTIPTTSSSPKVVERETEVTKDTVPPTNNGSTKDVQPPVFQVETQVPNSKPVVAPVVEPVEAPKEEISPTTLEAAKTLSKVTSQRSKSVGKGKRYKRRKESKGKDIDTGFEDISTGFEDISTGFEEINTGGLGVSTSSGPVSSARGQRERKAPIIVEETQAPKRTKQQIQQEETSLAEVIRLQTLDEEETAKQVHLDALLAKRMEEEELNEQQKQRKAQVQFEAQHYTK